MKLWVQSAEDGYYATLVEPQWCTQGRPQFGCWYNSPYEWFEMIPGVWQPLGITHWPAGAELIEYDLSGKKPKYVCTWVPKGGDE